MKYTGLINSEETMAGDLGDGRRVLVPESMHANAPAELRNNPQYWLSRLEAGEFEDDENDPLVWVERTK